MHAELFYELLRELFTKTITALLRYILAVQLSSAVYA